MLVLSGYFFTLNQKPVSKGKTKIKSFFVEDYSNAHFSKIHFLGAIFFATPFFPYKNHHASKNKTLWFFFVKKIAFEWQNKFECFILTEVVFLNFYSKKTLFCFSEFTIFLVLGERSKQKGYENSDKYLIKRQNRHDGRIRIAFSP